MDRCEHCDNCRFYYPPTQIVHGMISQLGECHRYPPRIRVGAFEATFSNSWCGEYQPQPNDQVMKND